MPKVLLIVNRFALGGPSSNSAYLAKYLAPEYKTLLLGGLKEDSEESIDFFLKKLDVNTILIPEMQRAINFKKDLVAYRKIKKIIKDFKPDIVHTHTSKAGLLGRMAAYKLKVPIIIHTFHGHLFHSYFNRTKTLIIKSIEKYLAKKSSKIICISRLQKQELTEKYKICHPDKVEIIHLGIDLKIFQEDVEAKRKKFREKYKIEDDEIAIGIIGRLVAVKNHTLFLKALKYVSDNSDKRFCAFIIGDGIEKQKIKEKAKELNINFVDYKLEQKNAKLIFTSWLTESDIVFAGLDIVAQSSLNEGTPVSLIEAQAANKPIVSTNVGGVEDIVVSGKTALLSDINNEKQFCENLLSLVENDKLRNELSKEGWNVVKDKFSYTRLISDIKKLYKNLLNFEEN